jgi:hypothetical protein
LKRPTNNEDFGHYLAGLIDGDGNFSSLPRAADWQLRGESQDSHPSLWDGWETSNNQLIVVFHIRDVSLAYYIKKRLGYGTVRKVKNKNTVILVISSKEGLKIVFNFINGKLKHIDKINQVNKILNKDQFKEIRENLNFSSVYDQNLNNY